MNMSEYREYINKCWCKKLMQLVVSAKGQDLEISDI